MGERNSSNNSGVDSDRISAEETKQPIGEDLGKSSAGSSDFGDSFGKQQRNRLKIFQAITDEHRESEQQLIDCSAYNHAKDILSGMKERARSFI
jgi:hypothetical protein